MISFPPRVPVEAGFPPLIYERQLCTATGYDRLNQKNRIVVEKVTLYKYRR